MLVCCRRTKEGNPVSMKPRVATTTDKRRRLGVLTAVLLARQPLHAIRTAARLLLRAVDEAGTGLVAELDASPADGVGFLTMGDGRIGLYRLLMATLSDVYTCQSCQEKASR